MKPSFVVNPVSRGFDPRIEARIAARFPSAPVALTRGPADAFRLAKLAVEAGADLVVACGGDGTVRDVAAAVAGRAAIGLVPLGTVNLVAWELGVPDRPEEALGVLESGGRRAVFAGRCRLEGEHQPRLFLIGVSAGPDADAVHAVGARAKRVLGRHAYLIQFLRRLARPVARDVGVAWDGRQRRCAAVLLLRTPHYGGRYRITDDASLFEPGLGVVGVEGGRLALLRLFWSAFHSRPATRPGWFRGCASEVELSLAPHGRCQVDGDPFVSRQLRVWADTSPITVAVPSRAAHPAGDPV